MWTFLTILAIIVVICLIIAIFVKDSDGFLGALSDMIAIHYLFELLGELLSALFSSD